VNYVDFKLWYDVSQRLVAHGDNIIKTEHFNCCDDMAMSACWPLVIPIQYTIR